MCIIAVYDFKSGIRPTKERVETMIKNNPDGVGIAYNNGKRVYFAKALTNAEKVMEFFEGIPKSARDVVFHARIATSGGISAEKCHPYPLTADDDLLNAKQHLTKKAVVFHNGVLPVSIEKGKNDTQTFIKHSLAPLYNASEEALRDGAFDDLIELAIRDSRLVIMYPDGVRLYGSGWKADADGVVYSNASYKGNVYKRWSRWDDDEWGAYARSTGSAYGTNGGRGVIV